MEAFCCTTELMQINHINKIEFLEGNFTEWVSLTFSVPNKWGRVTHICLSKLAIIGSDNGLSPDRRQAIIWTNAGILLIGPLGTNFSEILIEIHVFSFKKMHLKMLSGRKWRPFCLGLSVLTHLPMILSSGNGLSLVWCQVTNPMLTNIVKICVIENNFDCQNQIQREHQIFDMFIGYKNCNTFHVWIYLNGN